MNCLLSFADFPLKLDTNTQNSKILETKMLLIAYTRYRIHRNRWVVLLLSDWKSWFASLIIIQFSDSSLENKLYKKLFKSFARITYQHSVYL